MSSQRLNITLDGEHAAKLARLAARVHVNEGTLARSLLSSAIDDLDPDPANVASLLDGIDGAWERAQLGVAQAAAEDTISLDELEDVAQVELRRPRVRDSGVVPAQGQLDGHRSRNRRMRSTRRWASDLRMGSSRRPQRSPASR
jgi:hypothetical protein